MQRNWIGRESANGPVTYRLRDWSVSRQRYWGAPVPIVHCPACGPVAVPDEELPVMLPGPEAVPSFRGEVLARVREFVEAPCPECGQSATRDTETLDTFVDSAWYYLRYVSPQHTAGPFGAEAGRAWMPVDLYVGGVEHAILHLLYARFFCRALHDIGLAPCAEPFERLLVIGMVLHDGAKMSKSRGNVVDAGSVLDDVGADVLRLALLFAAPAEADVWWEQVTFRGMQRFLQRALRLPELVAPRVRRPAAGGMLDPGAGACPADRALLQRTDRCVHEVTRALEGTYAFNVAIASLASLVNAIHDNVGKGASPAALGRACCAVPLLLAPFAPHAPEEIWHRLGGRYSVHAQPWPQAGGADRPMVTSANGSGDTRELPVQLDGKLAGRIAADGEMDADELREKAVAAVSGRLRGREVVRVVVVPGEIVNVVTARP
jgi:leucyl-tRNA synthetase